MKDLLIYIRLLFITIASVTAFGFLLILDSPKGLNGSAEWNPLSIEHIKYVPNLEQKYE